MKYLLKFNESYENGEEWIQDLSDNIEIEYPNVSIRYIPISKNENPYKITTLYLRLDNCNENEKNEIIKKIIFEIEIIEEKSNMQLFTISCSNLRERDSNAIPREHMKVGNENHSKAIDILSKSNMIIIEFLPKKIKESNKNWDKFKMIKENNEDSQNIFEYIKDLSLDLDDDFDLRSNKVELFKDDDKNKDDYQINWTISSKEEYSNLMIYIHNKVDMIRDKYPFIAFDIVVSDKKGDYILVSPNNIIDQRSNSIWIKMFKHKDPRKFFIS